jgi:hypothetical protein
VTVAIPIRAALNNLAHMCDNLGAIHGDYVRSALEAWDKLYEVEAENKRLRNVLKQIVDIDWQFANSGTLERIEGRCAVISRAALKENE